jgi:hypothetical protein
MDTDSLVARVCSRRSDFELVRERVRHWSRTEKLIMGAAPVGRGRSRDFSPHCVLETALLNELADLGIPVIAWATSDAATEIIKAGAHWAAGDHRQRWLQIVFPATSPKKVVRFSDTRGGRHRTTLLPRITVFPHVGRLEPIWPANTATTVIIDITAILRRVRWSQKDEDADHRRKK